ncbi:MAG: VWA domain-containing protein [Muribaculaceae bacterium]|nr:VWA domain-containing protein [Muribaculaceae bacterium]
MQFAHPKFLWFFLVMIPMVLWYVFKQRNARPSLAVSSVAAFNGIGRSWRQYVRHLLFVLRLGALGCLIVILARPQVKDRWNTSSTEGTDIVIALDVSTSMLAKDLTPNRLERAKKVAQQFIDSRENDKIGLVLFAGEALTGLPMTTDREALKAYLKAVDVNQLEDGTAIGDGLATAVNRLRADSLVKSKSIILLTDGSNNTGITTPLDGARAANEYGIKIYSIGIGSNGTAMFPDHYDYAGRIVYAPHKVVIEEEPLRQMAANTGGKYFRADDDEALASIFAEIDTLETTRLDVRNYSHTEDDYMLWAWLCFGLVCLELLLRYTAARSIP